jgi:XRE family transcriptional regulator, regulator of sulfur utilization
MLTRRDLFVALLSIALTLCIVAAAQKTPVQHSTVFDWNSFQAKPTEVGSVRSVFRGPTPTLDEMEIHITTLNPDQSPHPPHRHPNEELIIIREGNVETLSNGEWKKAGPGSIIFNASNELHGLKNIGTTPAIYHVINWRTDATPKSSSAAQNGNTP